MKKIILFSLLLIVSTPLFSQCNGRYETEIFSSVTKTTINYSDQFTDNEHSADIYIADGDTETNRPLIIYIHGGSFYGGDKENIDCVDFCESFAKRGYVCVSINYRLVPFTQIISFLSSASEQYKEVLKATMDAKAAVRFFRKDAANGNTYGIDENAIFIGGYSAGGVTAIHLAYLDSISDLPTSPINVQNLLTNIGGIEGDAGNDGYSSHVSGVISFAGGIHDLNWIDDTDEPIVSVQGDIDDVVNFNCGPGLNNPAVVNLCGLNQIHPIADNLGLINDKLILPNTGHTWAAGGNANSDFLQALEFVKDFLYPLLPCNNATSITSQNTSRKLLKIVDVLGRETDVQTNQTLFYIYSNGQVEKKIILQ